jgi:hypothetical protein
MCDYSLEYVTSRPAKVADRRVSTTFSNSITRGFAAQDDLSTAVCLLPGTEIAFDDDVAFENDVYVTKRIPTRVARFRQMNMHEPRAHHDALEFPGGTIVLLTKLLRGQRATVLQLPAEAQPEHRRERAAGQVGTAFEPVR